MRVLLHVCCGPCATHAIERLRTEHEVTLFFSNSNIHPPEEYERRLAAAPPASARLVLPLVEDVYDHAAWRAAVIGLEDEPERGRRCEPCFAFNLSRAADYAREHGFDRFTTTLTISPHKSSATIFRVGASLGPFLAVDFKKGDGFRRGLALSREYGLYRQGYCGCEFSLRARSVPPPAPSIP
jgi:epoxyqueuosine reductase